MVHVTVRIGEGHADTRSVSRGYRIDANLNRMELTVKAILARELAAVITRPGTVRTVRSTQIPHALTHVVGENAVHRKRHGSSHLKRRLHDRVRLFGHRRLVDLAFLGQLRRLFTGHKTFLHDEGRAFGTVRDGDGVVESIEIAAKLVVEATRSNGVERRSVSQASDTNRIRGRIIENDLPTITRKRTFNCHRATLSKLDRRFLKHDR